MITMVKKKNNNNNNKKNNNNNSNNNQHGANTRPYVTWCSTRRSYRHVRRNSKDTSQKLPGAILDAKIPPLPTLGDI